MDNRWVPMTYQTRKGRHWVTYERGQPCKRGETAKSSGCIPKGKAAQRRQRSASEGKKFRIARRKGSKLSSKEVRKAALLRNAAIDRATPEQERLALALNNPDWWGQHAGPSMALEALEGVDDLQSFIEASRFIADGSPVAPVGTETPTVFQPLGVDSYRGSNIVVHTDYGASIAQLKQDVAEKLGVSPRDVLPTMAALTGAPAGWEFEITYDAAENAVQVDASQIGIGDMTRKSILGTGS